MDYFTLLFASILAAWGIMWAGGNTAVWMMRRSDYARAIDRRLSSWPGKPS